MPSYSIADQVFLVVQRANILKEVQIMRGTNHPNIIKLISFSESDEHYFLVLECKYLRYFFATRTGSLIMFNI
jgi:serine/threonine protein kinase